MESTKEKTITISDYSKEIIARDAAGESEPALSRLGGRHGEVAAPMIKRAGAATCGALTRRAANRLKARLRSRPR